MTSLPGSNLIVSSICLGGMDFCPTFPVDAVISAYAEAGGNFIDTAHCYGFWTDFGSGASERAIAAYFRRNGGREKFIIATKGGHPSALGYRNTQRYMAPGRIKADIDDSLARLELDTIDLYWLHRDDVSVPVEEIIDTLNEEADRGRIQNLGASNWTTSRIAAANRYASENGKRGFVASQPQFSLASPPPEAGGMRFLHRPEEVEWHRTTGFPVVAYSSTAKGYFTGSEAKEYDSDLSRLRLSRAMKIADQRGVKTGQVALAFLMNQGFPVIPIVGTKDTGHLREAIEAAAISLDKEEVDWLTS